MNKIIILFLFFTGFCFSQDFNAGLIGGVSTSQVSGDGLSGFNKIGPRVGLYINRSIKWYGLQLELQYLTKGSKKINSNTNQDLYGDNLNFDYSNNYNFHLEYIGVPILFFANIREKIKLELGTALNLLIQQKEEIDFYIDNSREVSRLETSILMGLTYKINDRFSLNSRITNSITPIRRHASGETYQLNKGQYNTALYFTIQYMLKN